MSGVKIRAALLFVLLTALTQIGGLVYLAAAWVSRVAGRRLGFGRFRCWLASLASFAALYLVATMFVVPPLATALGRPPLPCTSNGAPHVAPLTRVVCLLNRHYARQPVHDLLAALGTHMAQAYPGTVVAYLDAGFPFIDRFPLLPHLSHHDGRKVDLAYFYGDKREGYKPLTAPSLIGYWAFVQPRPDDPQPCAGRSDLATLRWDMGFVQPYLGRLALDEQRTGDMLRWLAGNAQRHGVEKILLEPHLVKRFAVSGLVVRFQGCRPARHDDHVHVALQGGAG